MNTWTTNTGSVRGKARAGRVQGQHSETGGLVKDRRSVADQVRRYWTRLSGGRNIPRRSQLDPVQLEQVLEFCFLLERVAPGVGRFRLAGQHLCEQFGLEFRGMPFGMMFQPGARKQAATALERCCARPASVCLALRQSGPIWRAPHRADMLLLPLCDELGRVTLALGCIQPRSGGRQCAGGFEIRDLESQDIALPVGLPEPADPGLAEAAADFHPAPPPARPAQRPALRLVVNNA